MRSLRLLLIASFLAGLLSVAPAQDLPVLKSNVNVVDIRVDDKLYSQAWTLSPETRPDVYEADVPPGKTAKVSFESDIDKISFTIKEGQTVDFNIVKGATVCWTRIKGVRLIPAAVYDENYRKSHNGKVSATIPEVYELLNILITLTEEGQKPDSLTRTKTSYFAEVMTFFEKMKGDPLVLAIDKILKANQNAYFNFKMNGNAFEFDANGKIVRRKEYDRTGFVGRKGNEVAPLIDEMARFAKESRFREFYAQHRAFYQSRCDFFLKEADLAGMRDWLQREFPKTPAYNFVDVVFSPLVGYNQSSTWFESNGFRTLMPHVDFPYMEEQRPLTPPLSAKAAVIRRAMIVFTEINHGYLSPASDVRRSEILSVVSNKDKWLTAKMQGFYGGTAIFDEYMNWGLIPLYAHDIVPAEADRMMELCKNTMARRGFTQFGEFQPFLLDLYRKRKAGETVDSLYPQILKWFKERN